MKDRWEGSSQYEPVDYEELNDRSESDSEADDNSTKDDYGEPIIFWDSDSEDDEDPTEEDS